MLLVQAHRPGTIGNTNVAFLRSARRFPKLLLALGFGLATLGCGRSPRCVYRCSSVVAFVQSRLIVIARSNATKHSRRNVVRTPAPTAAQRARWLRLRLAMTGLGGGRYHDGQRR